jgi:hypothetical protein
VEEPSKINKLKSLFYTPSPSFYFISTQNVWIETLSLQKRILWFTLIFFVWRKKQIKDVTGNPNWDTAILEPYLWYPNICLDRKYTKTLPLIGEFLYFRRNPYVFWILPTFLP